MRVRRVCTVHRDATGDPHADTHSDSAIPNPDVACGSAATTATAAAATALAATTATGVATTAATALAAATTARVATTTTATLTASAASGSASHRDTSSPVCCTVFECLQHNGALSVLHVCGVQVGECRELHLVQLEPSGECAGWKLCVCGPNGHDRDDGRGCDVCGAGLVSAGHVEWKYIDGDVCWGTV